MLARLTVSTHGMVPTCSHCGMEYFTSTIAEQLPQLAELAFAEELRRRAQDAIRAVCLHISQRQLEHLIGVSQGYLSRLHTRKGTPSAALVALLTLLAQEPRQRLRELEDSWSEDFPSDPDPVYRHLHT